MWQGLDRRGFPRVSYLCKIGIFKKGRQEKFSAHTDNIGTGGVCVILEKAAERFLPVELVLYLEDNQPPIECDGRVVWMVKRQGKFDTGIEFVNIQEKDTLRIEKVIQECLKANQTSSHNP